MKIQQFLEHHNLRNNPFSEEDAQTDPVFKDHCITSTFHPAWDKVYGDPAAPATAIVFGEKGAGKTAMRLQIASQIARYNQAHSGAGMYVIEYDDFNPWLDRFADKLSIRKARNPGRALAEWKLWDHMDAILSLGVTSVVDQIIEVKHPSGPGGNPVKPGDLQRLDRFQVRDILLLAACYDQSSEETFKSRWQRVRHRLRYRTWRSWWDKSLALATLLATAGVIIETGNWSWLKTPWPYIVLLLGCIPWFYRIAKWYWTARAIMKNVRVGSRHIHPLRQVLMQFQSVDIADQPLPCRRRTDDRYELMMKFQGVLKTLGYEGVAVLVDRVDEPHLINGKPELIRAFVWTLLDNKFLKHPGLGLKLLLPTELKEYLEKEDRDFYQRARLDKQNMVPSLEWTGEALYDLASARVRACGNGDQAAPLRDLFAATISDARLIDAFRGLRVPRHLFKFMYRLLVAHCNAHRDDNPVWQIASDTFETQLALYRQDQEAIDRGLRAG